VLFDKGELGIALGRLMMAVNDISLANDALGQWIGEQTGNRETRKAGAKMYFVRILISHVWEAMQIINSINSNRDLLAVVQRSPEYIQHHFEECKKVIGTADYLLMRRVRNDVSSHYLKNTVEAALISQKDKAPDIALFLSVGYDPLDWHFEPGDRLIDSAVVRQVFEIPEGKEVQKEVDRLIHRLQGIADHLIQFAGYFIMEHGT
jgi:hypothetical protein